MKHAVDGYTNGRLGMGSGSIGNQRENRDHYNRKNTEKTPGDLRRLAVTQTPVRDHQPKLV